MDNVLNKFSSRFDKQDVFIVCFFVFVIGMTISIKLDSHKGRKAAERSEINSEYVLDKLNLSEHIIMQLDSFRVQHTIQTIDEIKNFNSTQEEHDSIINQLKRQRQ